MWIRYHIAGTHGALFEPRDGDSGYDIAADTDCTVFKGESKIIKTSVYLEIPKGWVGIVKDRSSLAMRGLYTRGGVIDSSYRGEVSILLENQGEKNYHIEAGNRIAQILFIPIGNPVLMAVGKDELTKTERGDGNFGSTGK